MARLAAVLWTAAALVSALATTAALGAAGLAKGLGDSPSAMAFLQAPTADGTKLPAAFAGVRGSVLSLQTGPLASQSSATPTQTPTVTPTPKPPLIWPADAPISQPMWAGHPSGVDLAVEAGTPVRAARDGLVTFAGGDPCCSYGYFVVVQHDNGWSTVYGHLSSFAVKAGDLVAQGQVVGLSGSTGHLNGAHLHVELREDAVPVDPLLYLAPP